MLHLIKSMTVLLLCMGMTTIFNVSMAQPETLKYSPSLYNDFKGSMSSSLRSNLRLGDPTKEKAIAAEYVKFLALSPASKLSKINAMGKCLMAQKLLTSSELKLITGFFAALKSGNQKAALAASKKLRAAPAKSKVIKAITNELRSENTTASSRTSGDNGSSVLGDVVDDAADTAADLVECASTAAGSVVGGTVAGPQGAVVGAAAGKASGKATTGFFKKLYNWLWGKSDDNVVPGPNGEDCQPPFLKF